MIDFCKYEHTQTRLPFIKNSPVGISDALASHYIEENYLTTATFLL